MADNHFADMLAPGEVLLATLAGEGRPTERAGGVERTWYHLGLTAQRLLIIRMAMKPATDRWEVVQRLGALRQTVRAAHFPRQGKDGARLAFDGAGDRIVLVNADQPPLLPQVKPFLDQWGPVAGADGVAVPETDDYNGGGEQERKTFLYLAGGIGVLFLLCCGCGSALGGVRVILALLGG